MDSPSTAVPSSPWSSRRGQQTSSEESAPPTFGVFTTRYRVGTPSLRPLPLVCDGAEARRRLGEPTIESIEKLAATILKKNGIAEPDYLENNDPYGELGLYGAWYNEDKWNIAVVERSSQHVAESTELAILIFAEWADGCIPTWEKTVLELKTLVDDSFPGLNLEIEIQSTHLSRQKFVGPVTDQTPELEARWPSIVSRIIEIINGTPEAKDHIAIIALCRLGFKPDPAQNPITVYIALNYTCPETVFPGLVDDVNQYLLSLPVDMTACIEHNDYSPFAFELNPSTNAERHFDTEKPYLTQLHLGADIGFSGYLHDQHGVKKNSNMGTVGCLVEVRVKHDSPWIKLALTNYHIARPMIPGFQIATINNKIKFLTPADTTPLREVDKKGIRRLQASNYGIFEHPTRLRHNNVVTTLDRKIQRLDAHLHAQTDDSAASKRGDWDTNLQEKKAFFDHDQHLLGKLRAASGFSRKQNGRRMDWALIEVPAARQGTNRLPSAVAWVEDDWDAPTPGGVDCLKMPRPDTSLATMANGAQVWMLGAASGKSTGLYHGFRTHLGIGGATYLGIESEEHSFVSEYTLMGRGDKSGLAAQGDSGAIAYDKDGFAVGMIFRGFTPQQVSSNDDKEAFTLVTPLEDVFADIKAFSRIQDIRIAP